MIGNRGNPEEHAHLPSLPGTYVLVLEASVYREVAIGRLGVLVVQPGFYVYTGSAMGPGGLAARVGRHCRDEKLLRWHIDYLRSMAQVEEAWYATAKAHRECRWARVLGSLPGASMPLARFGASDCRCRSHLHFFSSQPSFDVFQQRLRGQRIERMRRPDPK